MDYYNPRLVGGVVVTRIPADFDELKKSASVKARKGAC